LTHNPKTGGFNPATGTWRERERERERENERGFLNGPKINVRSF